MIENRSTLGDKFIKGLSAAVYDIQAQVDQAYVNEITSALGVEKNKSTALFDQVKTNEARVTYTGLTGIGYLQETTEGEDYKSDSRVAGYETQFNPIKKTSGVTITEENMDDRMVDRKLNEIKTLITAAKMTIDKDAFSLFNYGFTAQASLPKHLTFYGDAVPAFSTLHPIKSTTTSSTTQSNASATGVPLTESNLEIGRTALRRQVDDKGLPTAIGSGRLILLVPDALEKQAVMITKSKLRQGTANNDMNIYDGIMTVMSTKWINSQNGGSDTAWFLVDSMYSPLKFVDRQGVKTTVYKTDSNKNITTDISTRYQIGNIDFRGTWGTKGDGAAYAS